MFLKVDKFFPQATIRILEKQLAALTWEDGKKTAGVAKEIKTNEQITLKTPGAKPLISELANLILSNPDLEEFAKPKKISRLMFGRYSKGSFYGSHNDEPLTSGGTMGEGKADVSFTIFLNEPSDYKGGSLVLESPIGEMAFKGNKGDAVFYDTGLTHRVNEVLDGTRLVIIGWIECWVQDPTQREILRDLTVAIKNENKRELNSEQAVRLMRVRGSLVRRWAS